MRRISVCALMYVIISNYERNYITNDLLKYYFYNIKIDKFTINNINTLIIHTTKLNNIKDINV